MSADGKINLEMLIRVAADQAKRELASLAAATHGVTTEAKDLGAAGTAAAAPLDRLGAGARTAAEPFNVLAANITRTDAEFGSYVATLGRSAVSIAGARDAVTGLTVSIGGQAQEMVEGAAASRAYQAALDSIRASYNPLFAASRQYEQQLERIAEDERLGAISAREAALARERAAGIIAPGGNSGVAGAPGRINPHTANIGAQGFDIGVTAVMGMNPLMIGLQQGSQLAGIAQQMGGGAQAAKGLLQGITSIFNMTSIATIGFTALAAAGVQGLMMLAASAKSLEERVEAVTTAFDRYKASMALAGASSDELVRQFGGAAGAAQGLYAVLANLDRLALDQKLKATGTAIRETIGMTAHDDGRGLVDQQIADFFDLGNHRRLGGARFTVTGLKASVKDFETAETVEEQTAALQRTLEQVRALATQKDGINETEQALIDLMRKQGETLLGIQAIETARAEAITRQVDQMAVGYRQEAELLAATTQYGAESTAVEKLKAAQARENLDIRLRGMGVEKDSLDWLRAHVELALKLSAEEQAALDTRQQWVADQQDRLAGITREIGLIGATRAERLRANAVAEAEIEIRKRKLEGMEAEEHLARAIARAQAEARLERDRALHDIDNTRMMDGYDARIAAERNPHTRAAIEAEKEYARVMAQTGDAVQAAASAEQVRARALSDLRQEQVDILRGQQETVQQLQLELALIGQTAEVRARTLALAQAERDILRLGMTGEDAERIRRNALAQAELGREIETQADAWKRVQSAGEDAVDSVLDKLRSGDVKGAFGDLIGEIEGMFFDLAVRNPLKNAIFGTDLGTWEDVGGWGGIFGRLTGRDRVDERALAMQAAAPVQSMIVTAANVTLGGPGIANLLTVSSANALGGFGAAGAVGASGLPGSGDVQGQIWQFFLQRGLQPHQIAAIMGNVAGESGFNPLAIGDGGTSFGLFQHHAGRGRGLLDAVGGMGGLSNVQAQLEYVWQELLTTEGAALARLRGTDNVYDATNAWMRGFERPSDQAMAESWPKRLAAAEAAMDQFKGTTTAAQTQLGQLGTGAAQLGTGLQSFGANLAGTLQGIGASYGPGGAFVGGLLGAGLKWLTGGSFEVGGYTGSGATTDVAGVVHAEEYVFDAAATRRIGVSNLEAIRRGAMRGYREGGYVVGGQPPVPARASGGAESGGTAAGGGAPRVLEAHINVSGTGSQEVQEAGRRGIQAGLEEFVREALPGHVRLILDDPWRG